MCVQALAGARRVFLWGWRGESQLLSAALPEAMLFRDGVPRDCVMHALANVTQCAELAGLGMDMVRIASIQ